MTGVFDRAGKEFPTRRDVQAAVDAQEQVRVIVEFLDAIGNRVTSVAHPFPPAIAATITGVRILPPGSE